MTAHDHRRLLSAQIHALQQRGLSYWGAFSVVARDRGVHPKLLARLLRV